MDLEQFPNFLLSLAQWLNVRLEVDNSVKAKFRDVQLVVFVFESVQPKSVFKLMINIFQFPSEEKRRK